MKTIKSLLGPYNHKKFRSRVCKGFTLIELVMVLLIIGILITAISRFFKPNNKNRIYSEICAQEVYSHIRSYINNAITGKGIISSGTVLFPDLYKIEFIPGANRIVLQYTLPDNQTGTYLDLNLQSNQSIKGCITNSYQVVFSGIVHSISIKKNLVEDIYNPGFMLDPSAITGHITFFLVEGAYQRAFFKLYVDKRTQSVLVNKCLGLAKDPQKPCIKRSEGSP